MNNYLIPANSKKGQLIFGIFKPDDAIIFGVGIGLTILMLIIFSNVSAIAAVLCLIPGLLAILLVFPVPNYHNVRTALKEAIAFYKGRQKYKWRGWCASDDNE